MLHISRTDKTGMNHIQMIDILTIPTESELTLARSRDSSQLRFGLQLSHQLTNVLEFEELRI